MPDTMSTERRSMLRAMEQNSGIAGSEGMKGAISRARELADELPNAYLLQQFSNNANPAIHAYHREELWNDTEGRIDALVAGVGTGGAITGYGEVLKQRKPSFRPLLLNPRVVRCSARNLEPHRIQGIGAGFVPDNYQASSWMRCCRSTVPRRWRWDGAWPAWKAY